MLKAESAESDIQCPGSIEEICAQVDKWLNEKHFSSAAIYTYRALGQFQNNDSTKVSVLLTLRLLLLGCVGALAGLLTGGGHDGGQLLRVAIVLLKEIEWFCGGAKFLGQQVLGKAGLPFLTTDEPTRPAKRSQDKTPDKNDDKPTPQKPMLICFDSESIHDAYMDMLVQLIVTLHSILLIATSLRRCADKDDRNRLEICDNVGKASCWIGCLKNSDVKYLLRGTLASIEGNWKVMHENLVKAVGKRPPADDVANLLCICTILMGGEIEQPALSSPKTPTIGPTNLDQITSFCTIPDIIQLLARCSIIGEKDIKIDFPNESPQSLGGLLELADQLFAVKKWSEATVLLDRCEEILTCNKRVCVEKCGVRNYRAELLYQRGRLYHAAKKNMPFAKGMYEASLTYCAHHLAAVYQLARLAHIEISDRLADSTEPRQGFPSVLEQVSRVGSVALKSICRLRESLTSAPSPQLIEELLALEVDEADLEAQRLRLEALRRLVDQNWGNSKACAAIVDILVRMIRQSVSYVPQPDLQKLLTQKDKLMGVVQRTWPSAKDQTSVDVIMDNDDDDDANLFGEEATNTTAELTVSDLVFVVLARHTIPSKWIMLLAKYLTDLANEECKNVWRTIRHAALQKRDAAAIAQSETGTLLAFYVTQDYDALHGRLKKLLTPQPQTVPTVDPKSREIIVMRVLHHVARGDLTIARQIVERALSYADDQVSVSGGQNIGHWLTYSIYLDLLVVTRLNNPFECKTKQILASVTKKDLKRRREDATAQPMPFFLRAKIQTLSSWIVLLQAHHSYHQRVKLANGNDADSRIKKNYKSLYVEAKKLAMQAVEIDVKNWRAALIVAEALKGLKQFQASSRIYTFVGEYVGHDSSVTPRERDYVQNYLLKETAYTLASEKPSPVANKGKLIRALQTILDANLGLSQFLVKLAHSVKDSTLADTIFNLILNHILSSQKVDSNALPSNDAAAEANAGGDSKAEDREAIDFDKMPLKLTLAIVRVGTMACMDRAKNTEGIKNPSFLTLLIADAKLIANGLRKVLAEKQKYSIDTAPPIFIPKGPRAFEYLVQINQPIIGPLPAETLACPTSQTVDESVVTQMVLDELPDIDTLQRKLVEDVEALIERLTTLLPLVRHEYATARAVREERLRESEQILKDIEARVAVEEEPIIFGLGGAA